MGEIMQQDAISTALFDPVAGQTMEWKIHWLFRIALFCEFVGHGALAVIRISTAVARRWPAASVRPTSRGKRWQAIHSVAVEWLAFLPT
jgi:hypothetical protein